MRMFRRRGSPAPYQPPSGWRWARYNSQHPEWGEMSHLSGLDYDTVLLRHESGYFIDVSAIDPDLYHNGAAMIRYAEQLRLLHEDRQRSGVASPRPPA